MFTLKTVERGIFFHLLEQDLVLQPPDPTLELVVLAGEGPPPHGDEGDQGHEGEHEVRAAAHSEIFSKLCRGMISSLFIRDTSFYNLWAFLSRKSCENTFILYQLLLRL